MLATEPRVVLIDEPTQGVDVRSRLDIYRLLRGIADAGSCVVIVSSDASELAGFCDRIVVLSRGRVTAEIAGLGGHRGEDRPRVRRRAASAKAGYPTDARAGGRGRVPIAADRPPAGPPGRSRRARSRLGSNAARLLGLVAIIAVLSLAANAKNATFLTALSIYNVLLLAVPLIMVAVAEFCVLLVGGIDVSIGSVMSLTVVTVSFWAERRGRRRSRARRDRGRPWSAAWPSGSSTPG